MGDAAGVGADRAGVLVGELAEQQRVLARAQCRLAALMVEFGQVRAGWDERRIADRAAVGIDARYVPGEFAGVEIGLAVTMSRPAVGRVVGIARRLQSEAPDAWDAWAAGDIDQPKAARINQALLRLTRAASKQLLNAMVVPVAVCKTAELLGRWLNQFVARVEPDQTEERLRRSLADRYVSVRPDLDGMSFLSAAMSSVDADAVDRVLSALAGLAVPGDARTVQQRRADVLVDLLLGRTSNGCHVRWDDTDTDTDTDTGGDGVDVDGADGADADGADGADADGDSGGIGVGGDSDGVGGDSDGVGGGGDGAGVSGDAFGGAAGPDQRAAPGRGWDPERDWALPASAFRPTGHHRAPDEPDPDPDNTDDADPDLDDLDDSDDTEEPGPAGHTRRPREPGSPGRAVITPCPGGHHLRPLPVSIGVVVSIQSLFSATSSPGQLADRSALVDPDTVRALAEQHGTLFYRLLTDETGNLLDVTELGRFPSTRLGTAIRFRTGTCSQPTCTVPGHRCDLDHIVPVPDGPTTAANLDPKCRPEHRAKTHAGHHTTRTDPHTSQWTTPTGHTYTNTDDPLPVENWPTERQPEDNQHWHERPTDHHHTDGQPHENQGTENRPADTAAPPTHHPPKA